MKLIGMVLSRLTPWKWIYLSFDGLLTLIKSVLSIVPIYWMTVFKLLAWVINEIDKIQRDFLWKGLDLEPKGIRLVAWKRICRLCNMGGWGILNLQESNRALLGKWWWEISFNLNSYWAKIIKDNYLTRNSTRIVFQTPPRNKSIFLGKS